MPDVIEIAGIYFLPPMAIARLGGSATPLENFTWVENPNIHGAGDTVIRPRTTIEVDRQGNSRAYLPTVVRFRDEGLLRPVAPFFELWANILVNKEPAPDRPLTSSLLHEVGGSLDDLKFIVSVSNRKAARRTSDLACAFSARVEVIASDQERKSLPAFSDNLPGSRPLVSKDRPIPLGHVQVPRPIPRTDLDVDLDVLRIRFTPARGEVYGPPTATVGPSPGTFRNHEIVHPANRILNSDTAWTRYDASYQRFMNPEPSDTYDGADLEIAGNLSWGVVDDTCDGIIEAQLVLNFQRFTAVSRIFVGPPHYAPDRRSFMSLADDLIDREKGLSENDKVTQAEVADLFQRVFETVSLSNLDSMRQRHLAENLASGEAGPVVTLPDGRKLPATDLTSMTQKDIPFAEKTATDLPVTPERPLPYVDVADSAHSALSDLENLMEFLSRNSERLKLLLRPPYGAFSELPPTPATEPKTSFRDPRVNRDRMHDMRMPPYMRDSDATALSLTRRQYHQVLTLINKLTKQRPPLALHALAALPTTPPATPEEGLPPTDVEKHVQRVVKRRGAVSHGDNTE